MGLITSFLKQILDIATEIETVLEEILGILKDIRSERSEL